jgi:hypothetical protein
MARRARMIGVAGLLALGAGFGLASPASAADTPPADLDVPGLGGVELCNDADTAHEFIFEITVDRSGSPDEAINIASFEVSFTPAGQTPVFQNFLGSFGADNPIGAEESTASAVVQGPAGSGTLRARATIDAAGDGLTRNLEFGPQNFAPCGQPPIPTSSTASTSSTSSTTSTTAGATTSTTAGATTSTVAGSTTSTSTTLGPNDTTGTLTVRPTTIVQGGTFTVSGTGFAPNVDVAVTLFSDPISLGTIRSTSNGAIQATMSMPANAPAGAHKMEAVGVNAAGGKNILSANVQVTATGTGNIARTGNTTDLLLPIGIAVVSFGILAFAWRERRLTLR